MASQETCQVDGAGLPRTANCDLYFKPFYNIDYKQMAKMAAVILAREALELKNGAGHRNMGESTRDAFPDAN